MPKVKQTSIIHTLPFPPVIDVDVLLKKSRCKNNSKPGKSPNCFLIYRKHWTEHLKKSNIKYDLKEMSSFVSDRWHSEKQEVKDYYKKLSDKAKEMYIANNPLRVIMCNNQGDSSVTKKNRNETSSPSESQQTSVSTPMSDNSPAADYITFPHTSTHESQFSTSLFPNTYISFDTTTPRPNFQNRSLKDTIETLINSLNDTSTLEHYNKLNPETAPGELDRVKKFLDHYMIIIENFSLSVYNHLSAIGNKTEELKMELEPATSNLFAGNTNNNLNNNLQDNDFDLTRIPGDYYFNEGYPQSVTYQPMQPTLVTDYSGYSVDNHNPFSNSQLSNNNNILLTYLKPLEKKLEDIFRRDKRIKEMIEIIRELTLGSK